MIKFRVRSVAEAEALSERRRVALADCWLRSHLRCCEYKHVSCGVCDAQGKFFFDDKRLELKHPDYCPVPELIAKPRESS